MSNAGKKLRRLTPAEVATIHRMVAVGGFSHAEIGAAIGVTAEQVTNRLSFEFRGTDIKRKHGGARKPTIKTERIYERVAPSQQPLAESWADRNKRLALMPRDLTAAFCGDPLPGYSALDRRT